ncbi:MAG: DUF5009 domain-containing protein [candidate division KSB1 bacterium]|nr:DUF5009 domain-containing protein [candidate division KSB1 bacterium]MDZ7276360.1 DUF5009 domain-containing protein [candidate division KSB1 bacterium]MDZ7287688.1 DUF5009 domain-containing protein [candidate division KSB1 bacterium]MDZ7299972.1 DUF5009 domain-containing protein [candidate division KSB1 bacterium]MDZ7305699.1 DUF5009 domain-containing protein [candidate division KSB1 bacterium]
MEHARSQALDALRGFAILMMVLSGLVPYGVLPAWMYHAQVPPPAHKFDPNLPGLTWVDLVFPLFLFCLGAALPLALTARLAQGTPCWKIAGAILQRGFLLGFFAIALQHLKPYTFSAQPTARHWLLALLALAVFFALFTRLPRDWKPAVHFAVRAAGWLVALALLATVHYPDGSGFALARSDIIIIVLANMAVFGSLIWLATRSRLIPRLGILGVLLALRLASTTPGLVAWLWQASPAPWLYQLYYLQYLFLVIPGMIAGELLLRWRRASREEDKPLRAWNQGRPVALVTLIIGLAIFLLLGLQARWLITTTVITFAVLLIGAGLTRRPRTRTEGLLARLYSWGAYWIILGLLFEPFEGGIKKDHPTLSYYFVTAGLAVLLLLTLVIFIEVWQQRRGFQLLIANGQNPMLAYIGVAFAIMPVLHLTGLYPLLQAVTTAPWLGFLRGMLLTLLLALLVGFCTKRKILWRT